MPRFGLPPEELRTKVIDLGLARMRQQGFDKVRLVDIAKDLGVSHAALYTHFVDRSALLDAITERWLGESSTILDKIRLGRKAPLQKIEEWFVAMYQLKRERMLSDPEPYRAFDLAASLDKPFVQKYLKQTKLDLEQMLKELNPRSSSSSAKQTAEVLFEATIGFHHPKLIMQTAPQDREPLLRKIVQSLLKGL